MSRFVTVSTVEVSAPVKMTGASPLLQFSAIPAALLLGFLLFGGLNAVTLYMAGFTAIILLITLFQPTVATEKVVVRSGRKMVHITDWGAMDDAGLDVTDDGVTTALALSGSHEDAVATYS